ncbi:hypothetical protein EVAR_19566_1 [Eumeta japonica]|uniref:Uncharacterized protein n=1 Tax=Eumeta variegata TaxID=151549 RepID=A0A4C1UGK1_EUMVA|nr:hypothetical protein EVAR_19566_1 [Eumeta japonica]
MFHGGSETMRRDVTKIHTMVGVKTRPTAEGRRDHGTSGHHALPAWGGKSDYFKSDRPRFTHVKWNIQFPGEQLPSPAPRGYARDNVFVIKGGGGATPASIIRDVDTSAAASRPPSARGGRAPRPPIFVGRVRAVAQAAAGATSARAAKKISPEKSTGHGRGRARPAARKNATASSRGGAVMKLRRGRPRATHAPAGVSRKLSAKSTN